MRESSANSLVLKILAASYCGSRIFSTFSPNPMIPRHRGGGGVPPSMPGFPFREFAILVLVALFSTSAAFAQAQRGTLVHEETIRVSPSSDTAKLGTAERGHELIIIDSSRDWTHVEAILREPSKEENEDDEESQGKTITGWVLTKALVSQNTVNGDKIVFGEAV